MTKRDFKADALYVVYCIGVALLITSAAAALLAISEANGSLLVGDIQKPEAPRCYCCEG